MITRTILYKILPLLVVLLNKNIEYQYSEFWHIWKFNIWTSTFNLYCTNWSFKLNNFLCKIHCPLYPHHSRGRNTTVTVLVNGSDPVVMIPIGVAQGKIAPIVHWRLLVGESWRKEKPTVNFTSVVGRKDIHISLQ